MEIKDLIGLSEPLKKFIEVVSQGIGALSKPYLIRKTAEAKAYELKVIAESIKGNQENLKQIGYSEEKLSLTSIDGESIRQELTLEERTQQRVDFKEQKRQQNIENITQKAAENLESEPSVSEEPVDEDWTTRFFNYAEDISNEEMQEIWARILAGEIKQPKSYSLRTLDILRNLSTDEAAIFMKFAKLAVTSSRTTFILSFKKHKLLEEKYGLNYSDRLLLEELGFITANDLVFQMMATKDRPGKSVFTVGNYCIIQEKLPNKPQHQLEVLVFTKIGRQLLSLVNVSPDLDYVQLLATSLNRQMGKIQYGMILQKLPNGQIRHTPLVDVPLTEQELEQEKRRKEQENKK
jgi:uncharacterized repeat protein (TIGR03899 family)